MAIKYVKEFSFPASGGFHAPVQRFAKGGHVTKVPAKAKASAKGVPAKAKPNAPARDMKPGKAAAPKRRYAEGGPAQGGKPQKGMAEGELQRLQRLMAMERNSAPPPEMAPPPLPPIEDRLQPLPVDSAPIESFDDNERLMLDRQRISPHRKLQVPEFQPLPPIEDRQQRRMDMVGDRGEMGRRPMPMRPQSAPRRMPVAPQPSAMVNPREVAMYARGGKVGKDNYGNKTGPYRGSPKKARELGRQDRLARDAMQRAERSAPGLALDMKSKGGMPTHRRKPMYGGGKC